MNTNTRTTTPEPNTVTLQSLERELAALYAALAIVLEDCFKPGAGAAMLGVDATQVTRADFYELAGVRETFLGAQLPAWFAYAYQGRVSIGLSVGHMELVDGPFERLRDLLGLLNSDNAYFHDCFETSGTYDAPEHGHLKDLVERAQARINLDRHASMDISELALLANMSERSVRNAVTAEGTSRLVLDHNGKVSSSDAVRWLEGRRGFKATTTERADPSELPESLSLFEIPHFLNTELYKKWRDASEGKPTWLADAAKAAGLSSARLEEVCQLPMSVRPHEAAGLAKALGIGPVWFTRQVLWALFPEQMDMVTNPAHWKEEEPVDAEDTSVLGVSVVLTEAMLKNGYLALPASAAALFPEDCFSGREPEKDGSATVELRYGEHVAQSNIRWQSARTLSPRTRFVAWFNKELRASPGDCIRIQKMGERSYTLSHILRSSGG